MYNASCHVCEQKNVNYPSLASFTLRLLNQLVICNSKDFFAYCWFLSSSCQSHMEKDAFGCYLKLQSILQKQAEILKTVAYVLIYIHF